MTVLADDGIIRLEGVCGVEEAETLAALLEDGSFWQVDLSACVRLHSAVVQALLVFRPSPRGEPSEDVFIRDFIHPLLASGRVPERQ